MILFRVFVPFALGYFLSYLYRVVNAVIAPDLVRDVGLDANHLGLLTSAYFLTFAAFQLPLGILLDRLGPRRTEAALLMFAAAGAFVFGIADSAAGLIAGRAMIGLGVSACLMAAFKAFVMWFPSQRLPLINGCQMAAGGLGALAATTPVEAALTLTDWRGVFLVLGALTLAVAVTIFVVVPEHESTRAGTTLRDQFGGIARIFTSSLFWRIAPLTVMSQASFLSIQGLWSGPWLRDVAELERDAAANYLFLVAGAMVAGFIFMGWIAERLSRFGIRPMIVAVTGMILFMMTQAAIVANSAVPVLVLWVFFGFFGTTGIVPYASLSQRFPPHLAGRLNTGLNVLVFVVAFSGQWGIGAVIDLWPATASGGYALEGYRAAFGIMLGLQVLALVWFSWFRREGVPQD